MNRAMRGRIVLTFSLSFSNGNHHILDKVVMGIILGENKILGKAPDTQKTPIKVVLFCITLVKLIILNIR